jgi:hypothetical protein
MGSFFSLLDRLFSDAIELLYRIGALALAAAMAYQSYDAFRSAFTGTESKAAAPGGDPKAFSTRAWSVTWGVISLSVALVALLYAGH